MKIAELVGKEYKGFKVLDYKRENKKSYLLVQCPKCGQEKWMRKDTIDKPNVVSCGCYNNSHNLRKTKDLRGNKIGRLTVIEPTTDRDKNNGSVIWKCKCECGNITYVSAYNLGRKAVRSCGCLGTENSRKNGTVAAVNIKTNFCADGTNVKRLMAKRPKNNTSGYKGVTWVKDKEKWCAQIVFKGKRYYLGYYEKKEEAVEARKEAEEKLFGTYLNNWKKEKNGENKCEK